MTKLTRLLFIAIGGATIVIAQDQSLIAPVIYPPPMMEPGRALKEYLSLTPAQITALQEVQRSKRSAEQAVYDELRQKYQQLENLLQSGSTDYQQIGRLNVEIRNMQKRLPVSGEPYRTRALAVLSAEQRAKLPALTNALQLQWPANDAVFWNLLDRPEVPNDPRMVPLEASSSPAAPDTRP